MHAMQDWQRIHSEPVAGHGSIGGIGRAGFRYKQSGLFTKPSMDGLHGLEYLRLIVGYEGVYALFDIAFHDCIQAVEGKIYPVIRHPALREVICPYPFTPVACP